MRKRKVHLILSALLTAIGVLLAAFKIVHDSEPGLIPLVLIALGVAWHVTARRRFPSKTTDPGQ
ncbi:MAG: hypothetical protein K0Q43_4025 [Ramlibacter sp.]|jgi:hypothetical protein|nr:hypothetical protein [Ramlibacter sp.]MDF2465790.1 hypothetical protein [Ramlibacter sp.]